MLILNLFTIFYWDPNNIVPGFLLINVTKDPWVVAYYLPFNLDKNKHFLHVLTFFF